MWTAFIEGRGGSVSISDLQIPRAREVAHYLASGAAVGARLLDARRTATTESILLEVETEVGQLPKADIQNVEIALIEFDRSDKGWPTVWALREGFPEGLAHTIATRPGYPVCLCIGAEAFSELRRTFTAAKYIERLRGWFADTALGTLHRDDQGLEPFLASYGSPVLILPAEFAAEADGVVSGYGVDMKDEGHFHLVRSAVAPLQMRLVAITTPSKLHGFIRRQANTLAELAAYVDEPGFSLVATLVAHLGEMRPTLGNSTGGTPSLTILLRTPLTRDAGGAIERTDIKAFYMHSIDTIAGALGLWQVHETDRAVLLSEPNIAGAAQIGLEQCNVEYDLGPREAAAFNGIDAPFPVFLTIGAGALGSHVTTILARAGAVPNAIIDMDHLSPHNLARHALGADYVGVAKARGLSKEVALLFPGGQVPLPVIDDFVSPTSPQAMAQAIAGVALVLDMSASQAVARELADSDAAARAVSLFLNPRGSDLVMLAEDGARSERLDELEMQYYWAVAESEEFADHLHLGSHKRYANGCRDRSAIIRGSTISILAGLGADAVRVVAVQDEPAAVVWRVRPNLTVEMFDLQTSPMGRIAVGEWTCLVSQEALSRMASLRREALPKETGGALMGSFDLVSRRIYIVGALVAPGDSDASAMGFTRGVEGLEPSIRQRRERVNGQIDYMGEWHSHPRGASSKPSLTDESAYGELSRRMSVAGYPETMLVISEAEVSCLINGVKGTMKWPM